MEKKSNTQIREHNLHIPVNTLVALLVATHIQLIIVHSNLTNQIYSVTLYLTNQHT